jgi:hypothetical protein
MASYTDNIPTFNPYVKQLPVEAMVEVGMYKQQKYDEGIQKIQTNIDNIAGLDVVRDVDKAYLQSKLNQLGNNLTTVAAGDFSNFQLVNSVNGMTNQISKDPNVLNAISSAKTYRKGLEDMAAANKDGKGAASHDWLFKTDANDWLNSGDLNKTFSGGYKQYSNYKKNGIEVIKALVKNETNKDVAIEYDKNGNVIVLDAITRTKIAGITPERIQAALMVGLSPNDFQSMQIDGRYNYSNSTPEQFVSDINKSYKTDYDKIKLQRDMTLNAIDTTSSASTKMELQKQVDSFDKTLKSLSDEYGNVSKTFAQGDVESAKARLHTTKWISSFSNTFSSQDVSQTYETSPFQQVKQYKETKEVEYKKWLATYNQAQQFHQDDLYFKQRSDKRDEDKAVREEKLANLQTGYGGVPFSVPQNELPAVTLDKVNDKIKSANKTISTSENEIMATFGKEGDEVWLDQQRVAWQSGKYVDPLLKAHFNITEPLKRDAIANTAMIVDINNKLDAQFGKIEDYIPEGSKGVSINFPSGSYNYSPKDFVDFNSKVNNYRIKSTGDSRSTGGGGAPGTQSAGVMYDNVRAKKELSDKEYYLFLAKTQPYSTNAAFKTLNQLSNEYFKNVNFPYQKVLVERNKETAKMVKNRVVAMQGIEYGIPLDNEAQKTSFGNALMSFANLADKQDGGLPSSPGLDTKALRAVAGDLQNATIQIVEGTTYAPGTYQVTAAGKDGVPQTFRVPAEAYRSVFQGRFEADPQIAAIRPLQSQQIRAGGGTTAIDGGKTNINNAYMGKATDFTNVRHYGVSGNLVTSQDGMSSIRLNITDPNTNEVLIQDLAYPNFNIPANQVNKAVLGLTDEIIFELLYNRKPSAAELKTLRQKP